MRQYLILKIIFKLNVSVFFFTHIGKAFPFDGSCDDDDGANITCIHVQKLIGPLVAYQPFHVITSTPFSMIQIQSTLYSIALTTFNQSYSTIYETKLTQNHSTVC